MTSGDRICFDCWESQKKLHVEQTRDTIQFDLFCKHCGKKLLSPDADVCTNCGKLVKSESLAAQNIRGKKNVSSAWWLLPIFLGWLGGIIMYFAVKDDDIKKAKGGLVLGIGLTVIGIVLYGIVMILAFSTNPFMY